MIIKSSDQPSRVDNIPAGAAFNEPLPATLDRWQSESAQLERAGIYTWLASRVDGVRVLEIGCGFGLSTMALAKAGKSVFSLDSRMECLEATQQRVPDATYGVADVRHYDDRLLVDLQAFAPDAVVCWLAGAPADALPRDVPAAYAVMQYRLTLQQAVVRLAARLESVQSVHLADRTAFPWKMKDAGRQTMTKMITSAVILDAPFTLVEAGVQFRKIEEPVSSLTSVAGSLQGITPLIGEATLKRRHNGL